MAGMVALNRATLDDAVFGYAFFTATAVVQPNNLRFGAF